jgi:hypothetical protein
MGRGPSYPYVGLEESIALAKKMYDYTKRSAADLSAVVSDAWKYSPSSSSAQKIVAALKSFGLIEEGAGSSGKTIRLTPRAIRILLDDENSDERREEIRAAALSPNWYSRCWKTWGPEMPPSMRSTLLIKEGFVDTTVDGFLKDYKKTLAFAGILDEENEEMADESNGNVPKSGADSNKTRDNLTSEAQEDLRTLASAHKKVTIASVAPVAKADSNMKTESFSLPDGISISVEWPPSLTAEAVSDFEDYLKSLVKRVKRASAESVKADSDEKAKQESLERPG